ncbi:MAG: hypothetical protein AAF716_03655 [Cyanobacteria bacterium P01_D01_bin.1]
MGISFLQRVPAIAISFCDVAIDLGSIKGVQLAKKPRCVKLPEAVDAAIEAMPKKERSAWIRQAIWKVAIEQGLVETVSDQGAVDSAT